MFCQIIVNILHKIETKTNKKSYNNKCYVTCNISCMSSQYQAFNVYESKIQGLDCHSRTKGNISRSFLVHICMKVTSIARTLKTWLKTRILWTFGLNLSDLLVAQFLSKFVSAFNSI